ncbi:hypothetical protein RYA05_13705 [Pseudomonas syringae pv. actinidiae]|uniref:hypothetical protein n=1 Tax=Pseudomonas viridiflava TaxID=33069 RepID=UPI0018E5AB99|nr:hypothetical protein [Pseudomonas viridiflava]MBI6727065.1 hypothetical protein [Pseudomonas viridiflava]MDU8352912.1 hypothetical protein [Pseudomonas syringae pv. actinidiae]
MEELEMDACLESLVVIQRALDQISYSVETATALVTLEAMVNELAAWKTLKQPQVLHANLMRGFPAKLSKGSLLHLVGAPECSNAGCCMRATPLG